MLTRRDIRHALGIILREPARPRPMTQAERVEAALRMAEPAQEEVIMRAVGHMPPPAQEASPYGLFAIERRRQLARWTPAHDDEHCYGELAQAAAAYAWPTNTILGEDGGAGLTSFRRADLWPFEPDAFKPALAEAQVSGRLRDLVRAGALIVAEIERLQRARTAIREEFDAARRERAASQREG